MPIFLGRCKQKEHGPHWSNIKVRPYLNIPKAKRAEGVAQVVECLPGKHNAPSSSLVLKERKDDIEKIM
jgi:hypothetical protein